MAGSGAAVYHPRGEQSHTMQYIILGESSHTKQSSPLGRAVTTSSDSDDGNPTKYLESFQFSNVQDNS